MNGGRANPVRRGLTILETVAAVTLLGVVTSAMFGLLSYLVAAQVREQQRLGASELANRLVLQYLDDPNALPNSSLPLEYGINTFRWDHRDGPVTLIESVPDGRDPARPSQLPLDRFMEVSVRVWLSERSGGAVRPETGVPIATVTRVYDPFYFTRNPDSGENMIQDPQRLEQMMQRLMGFRGEGGAGARPSGTPSGRPR